MIRRLTVHYQKVLLPFARRNEMKAQALIRLLIRERLLFLTGVPCSHLSSFLSLISFQKFPFQHIAATSEGEAIAIAAGYHLATNKIPIVYLQNSGFGNAINPLTSLMDKEVYSIPVILFLTWRGEPNSKDEPQHKKMGRIMLKLLDDLEISYEFASKDIKKTTESLKKLKGKITYEQEPVALIFQSDSFDKYKSNLESRNSQFSMKREEILKILLAKIGEQPIITTTGKTSRELFELREKYHQTHESDFLTVGSMGCATGIGLSIALQSKKKVFIIDGDGAVLMRMGTLATIGHYKPKNLVHIIIDNQAYESTGGQPSISRALDWKQLLESVGYNNAVIIRTKQELEKLSFGTLKYPLGIVIYSQIGSRVDLGRPTTRPLENKHEFMKFLS